MVNLTNGWVYGAVGGLTLGADPVALAMLYEAACPLDVFVVRKQWKAHGMQRLIEGPDVAGQRALIVEDVSTTGASALAAVEAVREAGAQVAGVAALVDRGGGEAVRAAGLAYRAAYSFAELV